MILANERRAGLRMLNSSPRSKPNYLVAFKNYAEVKVPSYAKLYADSVPDQLLDENGTARAR